MNTNEILKSEQYKGYTIQVVRTDSGADGVKSAHDAAHSQGLRGWYGIRYATSRDMLAYLNEYPEGCASEIFDDMYMDTMLEELAKKYNVKAPWMDNPTTIEALNATKKVHVVPICMDRDHVIEICDDIRSINPETKMSMIAVFELDDLDFIDTLGYGETTEAAISNGEDEIKWQLNIIHSILAGDLYKCVVLDSCGKKCCEHHGLLSSEEYDACSVDMETTDETVKDWAKKKIDKLVAAKEKEVLA